MKEDVIYDFIIEDNQVEWRGLSLLKEIQFDFKGQKNYPHRHLAGQYRVLYGVQLRCIDKLSMIYYKVFKTILI